MPTRTKRRQPLRSETEVLREILQAAELFGIDLNRQNTGGAYFPAKSGKSQFVAFGQAGAADLTGCLCDGRRLDIEVKREGFNPAKLRGKDREHFDRQLARLKKTNDLGGVGFWTNSVISFLEVMRKLRDGWRIVFEGDMPYLTDEPRTESTS